MLRLEDGTELPGFDAPEFDLKQLLRGRLPLYETHASSTGFGLDFRDITCFDHTTSEVVIGLSQLLELGFLTTEEFDFAVLHELKHYEDFKSDPRGYAKLIAKGDRKDGLGEIYFRLYNCTEDISVNTRNAYDSPHYRGENELFSESVKDIYRSKLFQGRDFSASPLAVQFTDYVLNLSMGVSEDIIVSPEVREILDETIDVYGKKFTLKDFVETYLRPAPKGETALGNSVSERIKAVDKYLLPKFEKLIEIDKERLGEGGLKDAIDGIPNPAPGSSTLDDFKKALDEINANAKEEKKPPVERAKERQREQILKAGEASGISPEQAEEFLRVFNRVNLIMNSLAKLWEEIPQKSSEISSNVAGHFKSGHALDVREAIRRFPEIQDTPDSVELMLRNVESEVFSYAPKKFRLRLVVDASGSMKGVMPLVANIAVALAGSMLRINAENQYHNRDFECELEIYSFGESAHKILKKDSSLKIEDIMKAYPEFFKFEGSTNNHLALNLVSRNVDKAETKAREDGEIFDLMIEITDGETSNPDKSKQGIRKLESEGVVCRGIRIGKGAKFDSIWNFGGVKRGAEIENVSLLYETLESLIAGEIERLKSMHQGLVG